MLPTRINQSRYAVTAGRAILARQAALAALVLVPTLSSCGGTDDAAVFDSATSQPAASTMPSDTTDVALDATTESTSTIDTTATTEAAGVTETTAPPTSEVVESTAAAPGNAVFPAAAELAVSFTFSPAASGERINNPYIAVWVEDLDGNLVKTISLWHEQSNKGQRWLTDLRQWAAVSSQTVDATTSGATRVAGDYSVTWDGTDLDGTPVAQGDYVMFIEAAREHGPYEITSTPITISGDGFSVMLDDNGELSNATAELRV